MYMYVHIARHVLVYICVTWNTKSMSCEEEDDIMEKLEYNLLVIYVRLNYEIINVCIDKYAYECI